MSSRIKESWTVLQSIETVECNYCVDFFVREDGSFGYEEFRRDIEDQGHWVGINYYSTLAFNTQSNAINNASKNIAWLAECLNNNTHG